MQMTNPVPERRLLRIRGRARAESQSRVSANVLAYLRREPSSPATGMARPEESGKERRRHGRVSVRSEIMVRRIGGFNFQVAMKDISSGGCRVEMLEPCDLGDPVIARLPELEPLGSQVCWAEGVTTGITFLTEIHPAVFDALLARLPETTAA